VENSSAAAQTAGFDKWDFKLYTRTPGVNGAFQQGRFTTTAGGAEPFVECGSCHDPHFETTTFLRMDGDTTGGAATQSNRGSRVCLTCHDK